MINITGCSITCDLGQFDKTLDNIRERRIHLVVSNCNITLNNSNNSVGGMAKTFYKLCLKNNRVISKFMDENGGLSIREENIDIDGADRSFAAFLNNLIQYIEY